MTRRDFFGASVILAGAVPADLQTPQSWILIVGHYNVIISVTYIDRYSSETFSFKEDLAGTRFCLGPDGQYDKDCLRNFVGSLALVHFKVTSNLSNVDRVILQERVTMIDRDERLPQRAVFRKTIQLQNGIASDIQSFGYQATTAEDKADADHDQMWCLLRQDLFLTSFETKLLVAHWRHAVGGIRLLDLIPGPSVHLAR